MAIQKIKEDILSVGVQDWQRRLFDDLIPTPEGTSYNSYLIIGSEKTVLIDTVDPSKKEELINNLGRLNVERLDFIVSNHAEQDHSGVIPEILSIFPEAKVVTNDKCKNMLIDLLHISEERFHTIKDGETLSLGNKTLKFINTPWVHWPETMVTFLVEDRILFSCDFFGSHYASSSLFATENEKILEDAKRYYAEIMMPFRTQIKKNLDIVEALSPELIAPSHGPVWKNPSFIINAYKEWVSDKFRNTVLIPFVSMHGSTKKMVECLSDCLINYGIEVIQFPIPVTDIGKFAIKLVDTPTLVIGTPTFLAGVHPLAIFAAYLVNALRPKLRFATVIGSYGWGGKAVEHVQAQMSGLKIEFLEPVLAKGLPGKADYDLIEKLASNIFNKHKEIGLVNY